MDRVFLTILNMTLTASFTIAVVCVARYFLRRAPKIYSYALWAVVLFNLICPFKFESAFSLIPFKANPIPTDIIAKGQETNIGGSAAGRLNMPDDKTYIPMNPAVIDVSAPRSDDTPVTPYSNAFSKETRLAFLSWIWSAGIVGMLAYAAVSYALLKRKLRFATMIDKDIYETDHIRSPFVLGFVLPRIYLPAGLAADDAGYILRHERTHIRRRDYLIKPLSYLALAIHWFNPLVWLAYFMLAKDMEMSCDECVLNEMSDENINIREIYSTALLRLATGKRLIGLSPLAFGEGSAKSRIINVLNFKKPSRWVVAAAAVLVIMLSMGCAVYRSAGITNQNGTTENVTAPRQDTVNLALPTQNINLIRDNANLMIQLPAEPIPVKIEGPADTVNIITNSNLTAELNLSGMSVGEHDTELHFDLPAGVSVDGPVKIHVVISEQPDTVKVGTSSAAPDSMPQTAAPTAAPAAEMKSEPAASAEKVISADASQLAYEQRIPVFFALNTGYTTDFMDEAYKNNFFITLDKPIVSTNNGLTLTLTRYILTGERTELLFKVNGLPKGKTTTKYDTEAGTYTSNMGNLPIDIELKLKDGNGKTIFDSDTDLSLISDFYETSEGEFLEMAVGEKNNSNWGDHTLEIPDILIIEIGGITIGAGANTDITNGQWTFSLPVDDMFKNVKPLYYEVTNLDYCNANGIYVDKFYSTATATRLAVTFDSSKNAIQIPTGDLGFTVFEDPKTHYYKWPLEQKLFVIADGEQLFETAKVIAPDGSESSSMTKLVTDYYWPQKTDKGNEYFIYMPTLYFEKPQNVTVRILDENRQPLDVELKLIK